LVGGSEHILYLRAIEESEVADEDKSREFKVEFIAEAEMFFDQIMPWGNQTHELNLIQIEEIVLKLRQRFGEEIA
jgi:hypothetical protein